MLLAARLATLSPLRSTSSASRSHDGLTFRARLLSPAHRLPLGECLLALTLLGAVPSLAPLPVRAEQSRPTKQTAVSAQAAKTGQTPTGQTENTEQDEPKQVLLFPQRNVGDTHKVRAQLDVQGELRWKPERKETTESKTLNATGELTFDERLVHWDESTETARSARHFHQAQATIQVGSQRQQQQLPSDQRLLFNQVKDGQVQITSPAKPLTREELELVNIQGNTLALPLLLPTETVEVGQSWEVPEHALRALLAIDAIVEQSVTATLREIREGVGLIDIQGEFEGDAGGAGTKVSLQAKCNFDLTAQQVTWFTAVVREEREISDTQPGFQVTARLRVALQPSKVPDTLRDEVLDIYPEAAIPPFTLIRHVSSQGHFEMMLDAGWRPIVERADVTILRLFEQGQLIAQLLISPLADGPADKQLSLKSFEEEVLAALAPHAGQIIETAEGTTDDGLRVIRVTAAGVVSEVSMQWVYYHVSEASGRRAALAFSVQTDLIEEFAERDRAIVETLHFLARPENSDESPSNEGDVPGDTPGDTPGENSSRSDGVASAERSSDEQKR